MTILIQGILNGNICKYLGFYITRKLHGDSARPFEEFCRNQFEKLANDPK